MRKRLALAGLGAVLALNAAFWLAQPGFALQGLNDLFGGNMLRAEVVVMEGGAVRAYRVDQGRIRAAGASAITLRERDGTFVTMAVTGSTRITLNGARVGVSALRRGMTARTVREGDGPAIRIVASGR